MMFATREVLVFAVWVVLALPSGILYAWYLGTVLGRNLAWVGGVTIVFVPAALLIVAVGLWLPVFLFTRFRRRARLGWQAPLLAAALTTLPAVVFGGPDAFAFSGGSNPLLAWWLIALAAAAGFLHDRWSRAWLTGRA
jgi:hypothetical protein